MKTKTTLTVVVTLPLLVALIIILAVLWADRDMTGSREIVRTADKVAGSAFELNLAMDQYLLYPGERPKIQFRSIHRAMKTSLEMLRPKTPEEQETIKSMRRAHESIAPLFDRLTSIHEKPETQDGTSVELREMVIGQLLELSREIVSSSFQLSRISEDRMDALQQKAFPFILIIALISGVGFAVFSYVFANRIERANKNLQQEVTERKRMEEALRKSRDELELRVQERTAELETYMKRLQESNQALQDFASIASHDMHEPLRKVMTFGNMLKQSHGESLGEKGGDYLNRMLNATERMQCLLDSLLEYSRVTTKAEPLRQVDLGTIAREVISDLEASIRKTGGEVHLSKLPTVEADPAQMRQLFQNLIGNALKFHKEGERPLVKVHCSSDANRNFRITVEDNGIGFEEKYLGTIFVPFERLHGLSSQYEGSGMGLAICKKIVERHGGSITARSTLGEGSTFIITLPLAGAGDPNMP